MMKFRNLGLFGLAGILVSALAAPAEAVQLSGEFSKTGIFEPFSCVAGVCNQSTLGTATSVDVTSVTGVTSPGVPGPVTAGSATGDFLALGLNGAIGTMRDFTFAGTGSAQFPTAPVASFEIFPGILTFVLQTVAVDFQSANALILSGTGLFTGVPGYEDTPGTFVFTGQTAAGASFSFSASQGATPGVVPEPTSMLLLGTGLFGAAGAARRRLKRHA